MNCYAWIVLCNGKFTGIIETNYAWAKKYWDNVSTTEYRYSLKEVIQPYVP